MIERVCLVAWRELVTVVRNKVFLVVTFLPVIALGLPVALVGGAVSAAQVFDLRFDSPTLPIVEVADASGAVLGPLRDALADQWSVMPYAGDPATAGDTLCTDDATVRIVVPADVAERGAYRVYRCSPLGSADDARPGLDHAVRDVVRQARVAAAVGPDAARALFAVAPEYVRVQPTDQKWLGKIVKEILPFVAVLSIFVLVTGAGGNALQSTVEEKRGKIAEVLLGAISPQELFYGKLLGHLGASLVVTLGWSGQSLVLFGRHVVPLIGPLTALYLLAFLSLATVCWLALNGAVGGAVNEPAEAQGLMSTLLFALLATFVPAGLVAMQPAAPTSALVSLVPPISLFAMPARLVSTTPPPHWQVWAALAVGLAFVGGVVWAAGHVFRVGLLLRGAAPPNVRTLLRWIREF